VVSGGLKRVQIQEPSETGEGADLQEFESDNNGLSASDEGSYSGDSAVGFKKTPLTPEQVEAARAARRAGRRENKKAVKDAQKEARMEKIKKKDKKRAIKKTKAGNRTR
jgi:hypothetical protein